jgi:hypothetical protein
MCHAVITAQGEKAMKTIETETTPTLESQSAGSDPTTETPKPKATKKAKAAPQARPVAPEKAKSKNKAKAPKKAAKVSQKSPKKAPKDGSAREGSKTATVIALLERKGGATLAEVMKATGWQAHSVRGFISGTLGKKMGLVVKSEKREDGTRVYSIAK